MGTPSKPNYNQILSNEIGAIGPPFYSNPRGQAGNAVPVTIWGTQIVPECTPEADVDGTSVQLANVKSSNGRIDAAFLKSSLQGRPIVARYFDLHLVVETESARATNTFRLNFTD